MNRRPMPKVCAICGRPFTEHRITGKGTPFYNEECPKPKPQASEKPEGRP